MRRPPRTRLFAASVVMVGGLGLAACGDDDGDTTATGDVDVTLSTGADDTTVGGTEVMAADTVVDTGASDGTSDGSTPSSGSGEVGSRAEYLEATKAEIDFADPDVNDCVAEAIVSDDVYAAIQDAGVTVEQFQAQGPVNLGLEEATADDLSAELASCGDLIGQVLAGRGATEVQCATDNLSNDQVAAYLAYTLLGLEPEAEVVAANDAVQACVDAATTTTT